MIKKQTIESHLYCKSTAELSDSIINDMLKADGNLKELLDDRSCEDTVEDGDRSSDKSSDQL